MPTRGGSGSLLADDARPLYERLADDIHADLLRTDGAEGTRIPSERRLTERYGVSRVTVRAALNELRARGILVSQPARGWVLGDMREGAGRLGRDRVRGFAELAAEHGLRAHSQVLETACRPATIREAELLRTVPGTVLFEMRRVRFLNDLAIALEHNRLPLDVAPAMADQDFSETSLYAVLREADPPQLPRYADYSVEARNPSPEERERLDIEGAVPILAATQLTFNQDNRPIELTVQAYRGDRYTFRASITD